MIRLIGRMKMIYRVERPSDFFTWIEVSCRCECKAVRVDDFFWQSMEMFDNLRERIGPTQMNCGYRCPVHNKDVGGKDGSLHKRFAGDVWSREIGLDELADEGEQVGFTGIITYDSFVHLDARHLLGMRPYSDSYQTAWEMKAENRVVQTDSYED